MKESFWIRQTKAEDLHAIWCLDVKSFSMPWPESSFQYDFYENQHARMWVVETEDAEGALKIIGSMVAWVILDEAHLGTIAVDPAYRRQGIAEAMLRALFDRLAEEGVITLQLEVRKSNLAAQALYTKFGFTVEGERKRYYSDNHEDAILMGCSIPG